MNIQMDAIYQASYLNMMSAIMKELKLLGELVDRLVPIDAQCCTNSTRLRDIVQLIKKSVITAICDAYREGALIFYFGLTVEIYR